jgi:hypothetical protein
MAAHTDLRGVIMGDEGFLVCDNINSIGSIRAYRFDGGAQSTVEHEVLCIQAPKELTGYEHEVRAAMRAVRDGNVVRGDAARRDARRYADHGRDTQPVGPCVS